ncbi:helix-turn-helix domain-containing protein [Sphingobacterium sp. DK4209]|uniref:Helix-turn-helix domain-containing protein n=1 Tax=Sphingobacterium zhuxiongii TaxID=2662364 RepID=A0A5Q0QA59_9SPHI|nr:MULTISPECIES: AraC family transcriptional regulator [unclassified Sphingobacterium]MVZ65347.1 helix-turn-helix domain-containing protein [Sphingobacterium sp. DK4209]QGA26433.1 helix-turn-helix domain-containing protein [Sphingobacterium sp. dk4302]
MKPIYAKPPVGNRTAFQIRKDYLDVLDTKWHYHAEFELAFIKYPYGKRIAGKSISTFEHVDLVFYGPNLPHAWSADNGLEKEKEFNYNSGLSSYAIVVHFSESCFGESFFTIPEMLSIKNVLELSSRGILIAGDSRVKIMDWMEEMLITNGPKKVILLLKILEEISISKEISLLSSAGYWNNINDHDAIRMSTIYEYIMSNFKNEIDLGEIASRAHMTPSAFCRYFKARTKKTMIEFINELRINFACQLLEENRRSITQICFEAGFNNTSNFNRRFKLLKGITPQQYKLNIQQVYLKNKS